MRIIAVGLGGAGCRIVDSLYAIDRRSSRVACVQGLAVDVDEPTLQQLTALPDSSKMYFPPFDPSNPDQSGGNSPTATIDIAEIISRIHNFESGENDAIFICCGLGGRMSDIVPHVIAGLRSSIVEPIFGLVTFPCLAEGQKRSGKAADDIDILSPLLDGIIIFDNETWYKKTRAAVKARLEKKETGLAQKLGLAKPEPEISPEMATYMLLNEAIVRRISLILKAGEFRADGGIDLAEVVLDSGEVLNTMKGGGFITIGYAVEKLTSNPLAFLSLLKPAGLFNEESKKRASRIVELAKQAIYHEISTPCDMTSAHKALVLIAGPSHELSMQGFMTVRKWIDRSIRGIEMRSGDYPVMNTKNVAIIVMLSGLENIPRVHELREIRNQARLGLSYETSSEDENAIASLRQQDPGSAVRDDMIILPTNMQKVTGSTRDPYEDLSRPVKPPIRETDTGTIQPVYRQEPHTANQSSEEALPLRPEVAEDRFFETHEKTELQPLPRIVPRDHAMHERGESAQHPQSPEPATDTRPPQRSVTDVHSKERARQRIEQELQRQRMMALSGTTRKTAEPLTRPRQSPSEIVRPKRQVISSEYPTPPVSRPPAPTQDTPQPSETKTVIIHKRTPATTVPEPSHPGVTDELPSMDDDAKTAGSFSQEPIHIPAPKEEPVTIKDSPFRAKDNVFSGKNITGTAVPKARDTSLMHTNLKPKKSAEDGDHDTASDQKDDSAPELQAEKKTKKKDDISWI